MFFFRVTFACPAAPLKNHAYLNFFQNPFFLLPPPPVLTQKMNFLTFIVIRRKVDFTMIFLTTTLHFLTTLSPLIFYDFIFINLFLGCVCPPGGGVVCVPGWMVFLVGVETPAFLHPFGSSFQPYEGMGSFYLKLMGEV